MKVTTSIVSMMDEAWEDWALAVNSALDNATEDSIRSLQMGFFCLEMVHFL